VLRVALRSRSVDYSGFLSRTMTVT